jgi:hypothetical protein
MPKNESRLTTLADLHDLAADLNQEHWVQCMGRKYFAKREPNPKFVPGSAKHKEREFIHSLAWNG